VSFLIECPECGPRSVYEFRFGGEVKKRPSPDASETDWQDYCFTKVNKAGEHTEWWFHRSGCRQWIQAVRNTVTNEVSQTWIAGDERS
jgi:heterotetrameric sarcosine oxidase delta subunit